VVILDDSLHMILLERGVPHAPKLFHYYFCKWRELEGIPPRWIVFRDFIYVFACKFSKQKLPHENDLQQI